MPVQEDLSLDYHSDLNQKLFTNGKLKEEVRGKLLQIAEAWREFAKIPSFLVTKIVMTGGNANFNYTSKSDIDLHLVIDRSMMNPNREFVDEYLQDKKMLWTLTHSGINIYGYPVELYAQDISEVPRANQGIYDVREDFWIQRPQNLGLDLKNDTSVQDKSDFYKCLIDKMIDDRADSDTVKKLKDRLREMRSSAIANGGEFSFENLVFKELRNSGYLDKLSQYEKTNMDKALSL